MNVYVDSSALLRILWRQSGYLEEWEHIDSPVSSELIRIECLRTIDRARIRYRLSDRDVAHQRAAVIEQIESFHLLPMSNEIIERAMQPFPTLIATLDALHLASALEARSRFQDLKVATHDRELALAATSMGFAVLS